MLDPAVPALIPVAGVVTAALIAGLFLLAGKRADAQEAEREARRRAELAAVESAEEARQELVTNLRERIAVLTVDRDEARVDRDESRRQVVALERRIVELEGRPTRGVKP